MPHNWGMPVPITAHATAVRIALALGAFMAGPALAQSEPLWELGLGAGVLSLPDYRGSDRTRSYLVPVPYVVYRGQYLKADRDGVRGVLFDNEFFELNLSLGASLPVNSNDNEARRGLPNLRPTLELGPSLDIKLIKTRGLKLDLRLPVRAAVTLESQPRFVGWTAAPNLSLDLADVAGQRGWNLGLQTGPLASDRKNHAFFYAVRPTEATASRAAYDAPGGYSGTQFLATLSKRYPSFWVGGFLRYDNLSGASFEDSPLVRRKSYAAAGLVFSWIIGESSQKVPTQP